MSNPGHRVFLNVDYYRIIGVPPWATEDKINKAYRKLQLKHHTDKNGDLTMCLLLNEIKRILLDKALRREYDATRDYSDVTIWLQNTSSENHLPKLPSPEKKSDEILAMISKWKKEFEGMEFKNNIQESMTKILDKIISKAVIEENYNFYCKICDKFFVSEDDHFDIVLEPYIHELIGKERKEHSDNEEEDIPIIFDYLLKKLECVDKCNSSTSDSNNFATLLTAANEAIGMNKTKEAFSLYHKAVTILSSSQNQEDVFQKLLSIIITVFANDQYSLVEACKCLLESYIGQFGSSETIQEILRRKYMTETDMSSYKMALASLHYLPRPLNDDSWDEFTEWENTLFYDKTTEAMDNANLDALLEILKLVNSRTVNAVERFLKQKNQEYNLTGITGDYKVAILLIQGAVAKQKGEVTSAAEIFRETVQLASSCSDSQIAERVLTIVAELCADTEFHHSLRINAWNELISLKATIEENEAQVDFEQFPSFLSKISPPTPGQIQLNRRYSPAGSLLVALKNEDAIAKRFKNSHFKKSLAFFDLSMAFKDPRCLLSCYQQAICHLLKEMESLDSNEKATLYSYSKVIELQCASTFHIASVCGGPDMIISVNRFVLSALLGAAQILAKCAPPETQDAKSFDIISPIDCALFAVAINNVWTLQKVNPLIMYPCSISVSDQLILENRTQNFQIAFIEAKINSLHYPEPFPEHLYAYHQFDGVWRGWYNSENSEQSVEFYESRLRTMISLLNSREWDIVEVEYTMGWPLIRTTEAGWKNNEELDLNFDDIPDNDSFTSCKGFELNGKTGEFGIYFDAGQTDDLKLFTTNDVTEIFQNCIDDAFFTLENPDPSMNSHPFQEFSYWPKSLKGTDYLHTLLHADLLLKEFTTGVEINILAPFDLRPVKDGFLQRLPMHLQSLLIPILERRRDPINFSSDAHRFWIQIESIECKRVEDCGDAGTTKYEFGNVTAKVNTHILTRGLDGKFKDKEEQEILDSAEHQFARAFTKHYDEIGKYFPILLRLKELAKIAAIRKKLGGVLDSSLTALNALTSKDENSEIVRIIKKYVEETIIGFRDQEWVPPHPIYTESRVKSNLTETLRLNNVLGKEYLLAPGEIDRVTRNIRQNLIEGDSHRFRHCANELGRVFEIPSDHLEPYIQGWFNRNQDHTSTLQRMCEDGATNAKISSLRVVVSGLQENGILVPENHNGIIEMKNFGECSWVPSTFCKEFGHPVEPPLLSDESDVEYDEEEHDGNHKGPIVAEQEPLCPSGNRPIPTKLPDLQVSSEKGALTLCHQKTSKDVVCALETAETVKRIAAITVSGNVADKCENGSVHKEDVNTGADDAGDGNFRK